jgi:multidrug efflux pump subunit AcrB
MEKIKSILREFRLTSFAVDNRTSIFLLTFMILLFGVQSYINMPKEQYPDASLPTIFINTPYFGNSAVEIENLITRPLEKEIESINEIKTVSSSSVQDFSVIIAEFISEIEMEDAVRKIKDAVDKAKNELPKDLDQDPEVLEIKFTDLPIMTVNVSGPFNKEELKNHAEYIQDKIESLKEVSKVNLKGASEREVNINVDVTRMQSTKVSFQDIENAVASENMTMSAGELLNNGYKRAVRIVGQFEKVSELNNIIVKSENQRPIYLKDIAEIDYSWQEQSSIARVDGAPVISLDVIKKKGENLLSASDKINLLLEESEKNLPDEINITLFNDLSIDTRNQVNNLENSIISGVILVVLILLFFLGLRNAAFVGIAIPLSMLTGILILSIMGTTMNIVVLFSLIIALGLLVDNAIVVVENIYRYMDNGYDGITAAKAGAGEVAMPIIASTATTLAAFVPLAFWPGIMGQFMKYLPITLIIVLSSSLFVALVINPVFTSKFMKVEAKTRATAGSKRSLINLLIASIILLILSVGAHIAGVEWLRNIIAFVLILSLVNHFIFKPGSYIFQQKFLPKLERAYNRFIRRSLSGFFPILIFIGTFVLLVFALNLLKNNAPKVELFPSPDPVFVNVFVDLPLGKDIKETDEVTKIVEAKIEEVIQDKRHIVKSVLTQIGENTSDPNSPPEPGVTPNKARITVTFVKEDERHEVGNKANKISTKDVMADIREATKGMPGVSLFVDQNASGPPAGKPINLELKSSDLDSLIVMSQTVLNYFKSLEIPGVDEFQTDVKLGKPELGINIDRASARRYELSTLSIASTVRTALFGKEVSKFKDGEDEYPIMVRMKEENRNSITDLMNQKITFRNPANGRIVQVPISAVADYDYSSTYSSIKRKDSDRVITIFSNVTEGYNSNEIVDLLKEKIEEIDMPDNVSYDFTGQQEQQAEDMGFLTSAFMVAIFVIFIILVAQFNSIISPFIIILSILFSTIGVFLGYVMDGSDLYIVMSGIGIISLAGIVVNNAIVLIDYINMLIADKRKSSGYDSMMEMTKEEVKEGIIEGGSVRLRPVLLTAITTVLSLIPLATGFNINFFTLVSDLDPQYFIGGDNAATWGPMAWTVVYGLSFATFLTLVVVPVMYWLAFNMKRFTSKLFTSTPKN